MENVWQLSGISNTEMAHKMLWFRTQSKNVRNFHFVATTHLEEEPLLRTHKFNRFERQDIFLKPY